MTGRTKLLLARDTSRYIQSMKQLTVATGLARTYVDYAHKHGADREALLAEAGLLTLHEPRPQEEGMN